MNKKAEYIIPALDIIHQHQALLETMSGSDQGWGDNEGRPLEAKEMNNGTDLYFETDNDDIEY